MIRRKNTNSQNKNKPFKAFFIPFLLTHIAFSVKHTALKPKTSLSKGVFNAQKTAFSPC